VTKPASDINRWGLWPADVEPKLRRWNSAETSKPRLTFNRDAYYRGPDQKLRLFVCADCGESCEAHIYGVAELDGDLLCDDDLVVRARRGYE